MLEVCWKYVEACWKYVGSSWKYGHVRVGVAHHEGEHTRVGGFDVEGARVAAARAHEPNLFVPTVRNNGDGQENTVRSPYPQYVAEGPIMLLGHPGMYGLYGVHYLEARERGWGLHRCLVGTYV